METPYVVRVMQQTPTRLWINNPTLGELKRGKDWQVVGATTNPTYSMKMLKNAEMGESVRETLRQVAVEYPDRPGTDMVLEVQKRLVGRLAEEMLPVYRATGGERGLVAIQGNPIRDQDAADMVREALELFEIAPNIIVKVPGNRTALEAFRQLTAMGKNLIVTSCVSLSQEAAYLRAYEEVHGKGNKGPLLFVTSLAGVINDYTNAYCKDHGLSADPDLLGCAGDEFSKRAYAMWKHHGFPGRLMGGGGRTCRNFTELVAGEMDATLGCSLLEKLNEEDVPFTNRVEQLAGEADMEQLYGLLPYYRSACTENALNPEEFDQFPPYRFFHDSFVKAWQYVSDEIESERYRMQMQ